MVGSDEVCAVLLHIRNIHFFVFAYRDEYLVVFFIAKTYLDFVVHVMLEAVVYVVVFLVTLVFTSGSWLL